MRRNALWLVMLTMALIGVCRAGFAQQDNAPAPQPAGDLAEQAQEALDAGDYDQAMNWYEQLRERLPESAQVPYNMGVASFRSGDYERASELFAQALSMAGDQKLRSDSAYNLGTSAYAQSLKDGEAGMPTAGDHMNQAQSELQRALKHYRQALDISPDDPDARANAELAYRRLKALEAMQREMKQTQNEQGEQQQNPNEDQSQQQEQQQNQPDDESGDQQNDQPNRDRSDEQQDNQQQNQPQQNQSPQEQSQQDRQPSDQPQPQQGENQQQDQQQQHEDSQPADGDSPPQPNEPAPLPPGEQTEQQPPQPRPDADEDDDMSRDEAEALLQMIRDKERRRQEQQQRERASRKPPVDKDW